MSNPPNYSYIDFSFHKKKSSKYLEPEPDPEYEPYDLEPNEEEKFFENIDVEYFNNWINGFYHVSGTPELEQIYLDIISLIPLILAGKESVQSGLNRYVRIPVYYENRICDFLQSIRRGAFSEVIERQGYKYGIMNLPPFRVVFRHDIGILEGDINGFLPNSPPPIYPGFQYFDLFFRLVSYYEKLIKIAIQQNRLYEPELEDTIWKLTLNEELPIVSSFVSSRGDTLPRLPYPTLEQIDLNNFKKVAKVVLEMVQVHTQIFLHSRSGWGMLENLTSGLLEQDYVPMIEKCAVILNDPTTREEIIKFMFPLRDIKVFTDPSFTPSIFNGLDYSRSALAKVPPF